MRGPLNVKILSTLFIPVSFDNVAYSLSEHTVLPKHVDCSNVQWWSKQTDISIFSWACW